MVRQLEKIYYPAAIIMIVIVIYAAIQDMIYLLLFIPVLLLLAMIKVYTTNQRLKYAGITTTAKIVQYESYLNFDEDLATSRRGDVKKEILIVEFTTKDNKIVRGKPMQYKLNKPELEDTDFEYPYNEKYIALRDYNPVGEEFDITYDRDRPDTFTAKQFVMEDLGWMLKFIYILSVIVVICLVSVLIEYNVVDTIKGLF
ncbi:MULTISPECIES: hypothetical protein [Myroides]|uniref:DUF3592 domain-containing protein n=2 Tax=Myroides odoratimimus TaxID=76832 RepID=A0AAI8C557_9FLAO|nr:MULTISPECIES: hypothetical protein [Myroides]ALU26324.1 hypothetical protein AS202_09280 [Myroides odoratimimus]APA92376.1 hypothetical protein BK054_09145 [Myroides sp. ZB35]EHO12195.1 hypothetical protein HMPREF9712_00442 [Myroides odoratimimus CCUG 10230]EKB03079.1 hypothetical protein HMPREF9711_02406 [Myroides odoratimimus CCUG 3837]MCO7724473.1 hypothetical protein [Myroides odoratimimus]